MIGPGCTANACTPASSPSVSSSTANRLFADFDWP